MSRFSIANAAPFGRDLIGGMPVLPARPRRTQAESDGPGGARESTGG
jgi:hypothetical protein